MNGGRWSIRYYGRRDGNLLTGLLLVGKKNKNHIIENVFVALAIDAWTKYFLIDVIAIKRGMFDTFTFLQVPPEKNIEDGNSAARVFQTDYTRSALLCSLGLVRWAANWSIISHGGESQAEVEGEEGEGGGT